jgi:hypothetical protein
VKVNARAIAILDLKRNGLQYERKERSSQVITSDNKFKKNLTRLIAQKRRYKVEDARKEAYTTELFMEKE